MQIDEKSAADQAGSLILHPGSRKLFYHWEKLRAERAYPARDDFSFSAIRDILPDVVIIERDNIRGNFRYRLAGTRVCTLFRQNLTSTDVLAGWDRFESSVIRKHLELAFTQYQPTLFRMRLTTDNAQVTAAEFIGLPVEALQAGPMQLFGGIFPFRTASGIGHAALTSRELLAIRQIWTEYKQTIQPNASSSAGRVAPLRVIRGGLN